MAGDWFPQREGDRVTWFINWNYKIVTYTATFSLTPGDVSSVAADLAAFQHLVAVSEIFKTHTQTVNEYKTKLLNGPGPIGTYPGNPTLPAPPGTQVLADLIARMDALVARIKAHANYTIAIGEDMGIEPPAGPPPLGDPTLKLTALPGSEVRVGWVKGTAQGIVIESQRGSESTWTTLGNDTYSPYLDSRPPLVAGQPEVRRYRGRYLVGDEPVGAYSPVVDVTTVP